MFGAKLAEPNVRFLPIQEPCDTWAVFDTATDEPAEFAGESLIGLEEAAAILLAARANEDERRNRCRCESSVNAGVTVGVVQQQLRVQSWVC
ncbi:hypothetical protein C7I87_32700 [Mesorhizobium sp. SARCC-RB16n]|nr:hypothetical protein C7I87_32700 [Mesorhizobium sp. SARCC-RB16n]